VGWGSAAGAAQGKAKARATRARQSGEAKRACGALASGKKARGKEQVSRAAGGDAIYYKEEQRGGARVSLDLGVVVSERDGMGRGARNEQRQVHFSCFILCFFTRVILHFFRASAVRHLGHPVGRGQMRA
jgi:hypothetical protein